LKVCAAIIDIFHLIPAASQKMLEPLTVTVLKGEKDLYIEVVLRIDSINTGSRILSGQCELFHFVDCLRSLTLNDF